MSTITSPPMGERYEGAPSPGSATPVSVAGERSYRYPGSPPFRDIDLDRRLFKGRDEESKKVFHSILSADLFLLYAVSGMGKSSLLNAGVMHRLRARGYWPVNVRLNDTTLSPVQAIDRQIAQADIRDTEVEVQRTPGLDFAITAETPLWDLLGSLEVWRGDRLQQLVLVLDQFEELFTLDWKPDVRDRFIGEFGQVVRGHRSAEGEAGETSAVLVPKVKFCIVIREDALGQLEALADDVPQIMQNRFRLGALDATQAERAIREPAMVDDGLLDTPPFEYSAAAARQILDFLQETERGATLNLAEVNTETSVDPSQLQIVCQYIERRVLPAKAIPPEGQIVTIATDDLGGAEGLRRVLGDFYRRTVGTFPPSTQRLVQRLCEEALISRSGRRLSIERDEIAARHEVSQAILDELVDQRLLRVEPRVGSAYYELSHDTLVRPILADRAERRQATSRRRRRFAFVAAVVVAPIVGFLAYRIGFDEGSESVALLEFETPLQREVDQPGDVETFELVALEQPSLVLVEPTDDRLDAAITLTVPQGPRRDANQLQGGEPERIVVPAGEGDTVRVAVSSKDASTGAFGITQNGLDVEPLVAGDSGSEPVSGVIDQPGALAVYSLDVPDRPADAGSGSFVEIMVTTPEQDTPADDAPSEGKEGEKAPPGLDVQIEIIDPDGASTPIDLRSAGDGERATVDGAPGSYLVVVRDYAAATGPFEITATAVAFTTVQPDETMEGQVESAGDSAAYGIDVPEGVYVDVAVTPTGDLDPTLEVIDRTGAGTTTDSDFVGGEERTTLLSVGTNLVVVHGYETSTGEFELTASQGAYTTLTLDRAVDGEVESADVPAVFAIDVPTDSDVGVTVTATGDFDPVLGVADPNGFDVEIDSTAGEGAEFTRLTGGGRQLVRVVGFEGSIGSFEIVASSLDTAELAEGVPLPATAPVVFEVDVGAGELLSFVAEPDAPDSVLSLQVIDPDGSPTAYDGGSFDEGEPATAILDGALPGLYEITVGSAEPDTEITATIQPVASQRLLENKPVTVAAPAGFEVDVVEGQTLTFTAQPETADSSLEVTVKDVDGNTSSTGSSASDGEPATVSIGAGFPGSYRVIVNYAGAPTDVTATVQSAESEHLTLDSAPVTGVAPTMFDIALVAGERALVILTPHDGDDALAMTTSSPGSDAPSFVYSLVPGQPVATLLTGEGTHQVAVDPFGGGDGSFTIEIVDMGEGPEGP